MQVPKWNCAFLTTLPMREIGNVRGHYATLGAKGRHELGDRA